eukprot:TRINITY_DN9833_c0_g1_i1.p1 TRINITY_DN9833_c0_g1~~TRINITY_DN9833_c0_g1_i1.p1  ORF type:complete len:397 (-),score=92.15 TRINITY_DN9833_c0_g1_i1:60-1250(-)
MKKNKKGVEEAKPLLGRPGNHLKIGIVGLPNVGKSTLFNTLTKLQVPAENYPFCTIDPNEAHVSVPDKDYDWLVDHWKPASAVAAQLQITDIAGLVKGAAAGEGLGNAFLSHIKAVDGIFHVLRLFDSEEITHVDGSIEPIRDIETIENELRLKDLESAKKSLASIEAVCARMRKDDRTKKEELETVQKVVATLEEGTPVRFVDWTAKEIDVVNDLYLLTAKPVIYLVNLSAKDYAKQRNKWLLKLKTFIESRHVKEKMIPFSGIVETKLVGLSAEKLEEFAKKYKVRTKVPKIIQVGYSALSLIHFYTCGKDEVKCWTIRKGTKAPQAAGTIHTDFMHGFVCAEVMAFTDYKELGSETAVKAAGKYIQQGKNYIVQDGDIIFFKVNAGAGLAKKK